MSIEVWRQAQEIKKHKAIRLPVLADWNYGPCSHHKTPQRDCEYQQCGGNLDAHQTVSAVFHYAAKKSMNASSPGTGKASAVSAKVLTPDGWRRMGDLGVGDMVLTPDGGMSRIGGVYPQGVVPIYRITLTDGSSTRVTLDHLWTVIVGHGSKRHKVTLTTKQLMDMGLQESDGRSKFAMPSVLVHGRKGDFLGRDPYLIGALLGDGTLGNGYVGFTTADTEMIDILTPMLPEGVAFIKDETTKYNYRIIRQAKSGANPLRNTLNALEMTQGSHHKRVPVIYMQAPPEQRLALLQGLMDTDGSIGDRGSIEFTSVSQQLAQDVVDLVRGLGGYAHIQEKATTWTYLEEEKSGVAWRVSFNLPDYNPFRLSRKASKWRKGMAQNERRILSIVPDGEEEAQCIWIGHPDHLYITDDYIPTHNTNSMLATLCLIKHYGLPLKAVVIVPTSAVKQWAAETQRFAPGLKTIAVTSGLTKPERQRVYASNWEVLIIGYHLLTRDVLSLEALKPKQVISDDVDPLTRHTNKTHKAIASLALHADRTIVANATNIQTQITQLHAAAIPVTGPDGKDLWGKQHKFETMFIQKVPVYIETTRLNQKKQKVKVTQKVMQAKGVKNMDVLSALYDLICIRYSYEDLEDSADIPSVVSETVWLDLHPEQRRKYEQLQQGLLELKKKEFDSPQQKLVAALAKFTYGAQICAGLPALGEEDGEGASSKLDWFMEKITGVWADEKAILYAKNIGTIEALHERLDKAGVGYATVWGRQPDAQARVEEQKRFREDPNCQVMIISAAGERSLNLQYARILVMLDSQYNPARVRQIVGRARRVGSKFKRIYVFMLYATDTQEERISKVLAARQAIADAAAGEEGDELFEHLTADELLRLIAP